jgi:uncharacterized OB-fold protein
MRKDPLPAEGGVSQVRRLDLREYHPPPRGHGRDVHRFTEQTPLPIAIVELMEGLRVMVQIGDLADPSELEIGMRVRLEFRRISWDGEAGVIFYGHKAVTA